MTAYLPWFGTPVGPWHQWFAWRPVDTEDRGWRWMRPVWRRRIQKKATLPGTGSRWFQHAVDVPGGDRDG